MGSLAWCSLSWDFGRFLYQLLFVGEEEEALFQMNMLVKRF